MFEGKERCINLNDLEFVLSENLSQTLLCDVDVITKTEQRSDSFKLAVVNYQDYRPRVLDDSTAKLLETLDKMIVLDINYTNYFEQAIYSEAYDIFTNQEYVSLFINGFQIDPDFVPKYTQKL